MVIAVANDHAGYPLRDILIETLRKEGAEVLDLGTHSTAPVDYPDYAESLGLAILAGRADLGLLICGSGVGAAVAACKLPGIRAATCHDVFSAHQGREDDDCNVLCLGARVVGPSLAADLVRTFMHAKFSGAERHQRRVEKIHQLELKYGRS
jgi:ribose 5-phosphate isomerase B